MEQVTFTNTRGDSVTFGGDEVLLITIDGLGDVGADIQTQKSPFQDGSTFVDAPLEERPITIEFLFQGADYAEIQSKRQMVARVLNPKLGLGLLEYKSGDLVREIRAIANSVPLYPDGSGNRTKRFQKGMINLTCPNPFWRSPQISEEPAFEPLFQFPFEGVFEMGVQRDQRVIVNNGDAPSPLYIEFYGPAVNPIITNNSTGEYIKVNRTLAEGEYMRIDTTSGQKSVEFVAPDGTVTNVFNWIDLGSSFFSLIVGENDIQYSADSDIQGAIVNIRYSNLFNAV